MEEQHTPQERLKAIEEERRVLKAKLVRERQDNIKTRKANTAVRNARINSTLKALKEIQNLANKYRKLNKTGKESVDVLGGIKEVIKAQEAKDH